MYEGLLEYVCCSFTVSSEPVGKYEAVKAAANGRTLEVVPHCRLLEDVDFPGRDVASSSLKLTDV